MVDGGDSDLQVAPKVAERSNQLIKLCKIVGHNAAPSGFYSCSSCQCTQLFRGSSVQVI